jgi:hypothetical protein
MKRKHKMLVRTVEITNISNQVIPIPYNPISIDSNSTEIDPTKSGIFHLQPGVQFSIEADRLLDIKPLLRAGLITMIIRKAKAKKPKKKAQILSSIASVQGTSNVFAVGGLGYNTVASAQGISNVLAEAVVPFALTNSPPASIIQWEAFSWRATATSPITVAYSLDTLPDGFQLSAWDGEGISYWETDEFTTPGTYGPYRLIFGDGVDTLQYDLTFEVIEFS